MMGRRKRAAIAVHVGCAALWGCVSSPALALCPNCLGQTSTLSTTLRLVGLFLLVPAAVFFSVALWIRRIQRR